MNKRIDLNCDIGEGYGVWRLSGEDTALLDLVSSANIACGFHAGDPLTIAATVRAAVERDVAVGAHPSFPDLPGFGRRSMNLTADDVESGVIYQIGAVAAFARANGARLTHVKPHGAMYNDAARYPELAAPIARAVARVDKSLILVGLPHSALIKAGKDEGLTTAAEGFCDRAYESDGSLRSRNLPGSVYSDPDKAARQALDLARSGHIQTICIHSDTPNAAAMALAVRAALSDDGFTIAPLAQP